MEHRANRNLRTFFFRCPGCGVELLHTVDLNNATEMAKVEEAPLCNCGATMQAAGIPRLVMPEPGGDGLIYEVEELKR